MGLSCGKEQFDVDKNSGFTTQTDGFYRTFEHLSYWSGIKNGKGNIEPEISVENRSAASTVRVNGNGKSESSSTNGEESKSNTMKTINE